MSVRRIIVSVIIMAQIASICATEGVIRTAVLADNVRSLRIRYDDADVPDRPVLFLGDESSLEISFDELSHTSHQYSYTLLHLNADNRPSDLLQSEYLVGSVSESIYDYDFSLNTQQLYTHYRFLFPNSEMTVGRSGNYALMIYEDQDVDHPIAYACFEVVEPKVDISAVCRSRTDIELQGRFQQLDIDVQTNQLNIRNADEIILYVQQNGRYDNAVFQPRPTYVEQHRLRYINQRQLIFEGGQEYRHFDIASVYLKGYGVDNIQFDHNFYHAFLFPDDIRTSDPYLSDMDANGMYVINAERANEDDYEADYMWVHFILPKDTPWFDGSLYVVGDMNYNFLDATSRMAYDYEHHAYTYSAYLKQGAYSYLYLFRPKTSDVATTLRAEGSHWQTENEYTIYVYYRPFGARADELIGFKRIKSN